MTGDRDLGAFPPERVLPGDRVRVSRRKRVPAGGRGAVTSIDVVNAGAGTPAAGRHLVEALPGLPAGCWWKRQSPPGQPEPRPGYAVAWEYMYPDGDLRESTESQVHWERAA